MFRTLQLTLLLPCALLTVNLCFAQESSFGFTGGAVFSSFTSPLDPYQPIGGLCLGLWSQRWLTPEWSFQPELMLCQQGAQRVIDPYTTPRTRMHYARVPLLLRYHATKSFSLLVGPDAGWLIGAKEKWNGESTQRTSATRGLDLAFDMGAQLELQGGLALGVRYAYGLTQVEKAPAIDFTTNRSLRITLNYCWVSYIHRARTRMHGSGHRGGKTAHSRLHLL